MEKDSPYGDIPPPHPDSIPNIDPHRGYEKPAPEKVEELERTHEDVGPRLPRSHDRRDNPLRKKT